VGHGRIEVSEVKREKGQATVTHVKEKVVVIKELR